MVARGDEHRHLHPFQGPIYGLVALPGVGSVEDVARDQDDVTALADADVGDLPGQSQHGRPELPALGIGKFPQGGIHVPVCGV